MLNFKRTKTLTAQYDINSLAFRPDGLQLATSGVNADGVDVFDVASGYKLGCCPFTASPVVRNGIRWSSSGLIASIDGISGNRLRIWSDKTYELVKEISFDGCKAISSFEFDPSGQKLLISYPGTGSLVMTIRVYETTLWDFQTISSTAVEVTKAKWLGSEIITAGRSRSDPFGLTISRIYTNTNTFVTFPISNSMPGEILLDVFPANGDVCISWTGLSPRDSILHLATLNLVGGTINDLRTRHLAGVNCTAFKFLSNSSKLALDLFDNTNQPIKLFDAHTLEMLPVDIGWKRTSGGFDVSQSRNSIAVALENVALILSDADAA